MVFDVFFTHFMPLVFFYFPWRNQGMKKEKSGDVFKKDVLKKEFI